MGVVVRNVANAAEPPRVDRKIANTLSLEKAKRFLDHDLPLLFSVLV
ncbi:hypothetical protein ACFLYI_00765 [Chloroflexota bacterium]